MFEYILLSLFDQYKNSEIVYEEEGEEKKKQSTVSIKLRPSGISVAQGKEPPIDKDEGRNESCRC